MALANSYEAQIVELLGDRGDVIRFTVADATSMSKGSLCKLTDARTASKSSAQDVWAGIAAADKVASDGSTSLGLYTRGIFEMRCTSAEGITAGGTVALSGANLIHLASAGDMDTGKAFGRALEDFSANEEGLVLVGF